MKKLLLGILCIASVAVSAEHTDFLLGRELLDENSAKMAAIEFRRFALESKDPVQQAQTYLHAAYAYLRAANPATAEKMLRRAEALNPEETALPLLYAEAAATRGDIQTALYFLDLFPDRPEQNDSLDVFTRRRTAELLLRGGEASKARTRLSRSPADETASLAALDAYTGGPRKSPVLGGVLGLIPGAGYWYSGEIANGFRSLLLNSLFMFGMYQTAAEEQWGAFAMASFFEITWYSGSIYGGMDAAHRYNRNRLNECIDHFNVPDLEPDPNATIPIFQLKVVF